MVFLQYDPQHTLQLMVCGWTGMYMQVCGLKEISYEYNTTGDIIDSKGIYFGMGHCHWGESSLFSTGLYLWLLL